MLLIILRHSSAKINTTITAKIAPVLSIATELLTERSEKSLVTDRIRFELVTFSFYPYLGLFLT